jgi:recombination protein RecR
MMLYIESQLEGFDLKFTKIALGVPTGISLENVDTLSLARAIEDRVSI